LQPQTSQPIPWTYLIAEKVEGPLVTCRMETSLEAPVIPDFYPTRERLAVGVSIGSQPTELRVESPDDPPRPLADLEVYYADGQSRRHVGRTAFDGSLSLPAHGETPLWLEIMRGETLLARRPLVPGLEDHLLIKAAEPTLDPMLAAQLLDFNDRLADQVARRAILVAEVQGHLEANDLVKAKERINQLRALPSASKLLEDLNLLQEKGNKPGANSAAEIEAIRSLIKKHLAPKVIDDLEKLASPEPK
jgi:hypothetical protein